MAEIKLKTEDGKILTILAKDGVNGTNGEKGERGDTGPKGDTGKQGERGLQGEQGIPGVNGKDGRDGLDGNDGAIGPKGERGDQGPAGKSLSQEDIERISKGLNKTKKENFLFANTGVNSITAGSNITITGTTQDPIISSTSSASGDVVGPASAIDDEIVVFNGITGKLIRSAGQTFSALSLIIANLVTGKQDTLVSGTNIKTINGDSLLGSGDMVIPIGINEDSFGIVVDGAGVALTTGAKGTKYIPFDCTITGWDIRSDVSGDCVFDVKRAGVSLAGTEKPTLSSASSNSDLALSTWTTSLTAGDVVEFIVDSAATLTRATVTILVTKI